MWRINFDPNIGMFVIQFLFFTLWWKDVRTEDGTRRTFGTYQAARDWAESAGLPNAFHEQETKRAYRQHTLGYGTHYKI